jgi:hypothetical protein
MSIYNNYIDLNSNLQKFESANIISQSTEYINQSYNTNLQIYQLELKLCSTLDFFVNFEYSESNLTDKSDKFDIPNESYKSDTNVEKIYDLNYLNIKSNKSYKSVKFEKSDLSDKSDKSESLESILSKNYIFYTPEFNNSVYRTLSLYKNLENLDFNYNLSTKNLHTISSDIFVLNKICDCTINFNYTYGFFNTQNNFYVLEEKYAYNLIHSNIEFNEFLNLFLQILFSLQIVYNKYKYTHYNLSFDKIHIIKKDTICTLKYVVEGSVYYLNTKYIVKITNSKYNRFTYNNRDYYLAGYLNFGITESPNNLIDIYKFLFTFLDFCVKNNNFECIKKSEPLIKYFYNSNYKIENLIHKIKESNYYFESLESKNYNNYINYILQIYNPVFIQSEPKYNLLEYNKLFKGLNSQASLFLLQSDSYINFEKFESIGLIIDYYNYNKTLFKNIDSQIYKNLEDKINNNEFKIQSVISNLCFPYYSSVDDLTNLQFLDSLKTFCFNILTIYCTYKINIYLYNIYLQICKYYKFKNNIIIPNIYNLLLEGSEKLIQITNFSNNLNNSDKNILKKVILQNSKFNFYFNFLIIYNTILKTHLYN